MNFRLRTELSEKFWQLYDVFIPLIFVVQLIIPVSGDHGAAEVWITYLNRLNFAHNSSDFTSPRRQSGTECNGSSRLNKIIHGGFYIQNSYTVILWRTSSNIDAHRRYTRLCYGHTVALKSIFYAICGHAKFPTVL